MATGILEKLKLPNKTIADLKREAERRGVTTDKYLKEVIEEHLDRMKRIQNSTFAELAKPLKETFKGKTEEELDLMVEAARKRIRSRKLRQSK